MKKILVANRGEIALRIMRSCREMGIKTVAVYSEADRYSPHVKYADEAVCIGPAPSNQSYLRGEKIIEAALKTGADGIHPGYGFLSENAAFARMVSQSGIIFIGPSPEAMEIMGSKLGAKAAVKKYNIPLVPGTEHAISNLEEAMEVGRKIGFPILIKASAGGGGKGMRIVEKEEEFEENLKRAISEAESAFGDGSVFLEKYLRVSKHIEIQVLCDQHGNFLHLFERECSIQRRHQKVIEEAPSAILTPEQRMEMGAHAVNVARACNYVGAGTVEFIYSDGEYYFLEMNTRLQVEHPVTEMITGIDLVKEQIRIARGEKLCFKQEDLTIRGHAIEVRVYAEDPANQFLPDIGTLNTYKAPHGPGIRVDDGFAEGMQIPIYYDPMIAKMVVHASTRDEAIEKAIRAIDEYRITGVETTLSFCRFVLNHEEFRKGTFNTHFVNTYFKPEYLKPNFTNEELEIAALVSADLFSSSSKKPATVKTSNASTNQTGSVWRINRSF
ncbi:MAG: acetyl-CoA carboxylase biotin carboxylase subunit [Flavobacteriales bacterium]|nr:acetyl-CoA carboxylase biotin carboxylase subunit [Flavobacteriales bacterium]